MSKLPYFPCYARDVLSSSKIALMSGEAFKAYWLLLCASWLEDERATLPNNEAKLEALARVDTSTWLKIKDEVLACFDTAGNGRLFSPRLLEVSFLQEKRRDAGSKGGSKTQAGSEANYEANFKQTTKHQSQSSESEEEPEPEKKKEEEPLTDYEQKIETYFSTKINRAMIIAWNNAHRTISVDKEILKAKAWLFSNQDRKQYSRFGRFLSNWMNNAANPPEWMKSSKGDFWDEVEKESGGLYG